MNDEQMEIRKEVMNNMINKLKEFAAEEKCTAVWLVALYDTSEETGIEESHAIDFTATMDQLQAAQVLNRVTVEVGLNAAMQLGMIEPSDDHEAPTIVHTHSTTQ